MLSHEDVQAALSARLDGEESNLADDVVDTHVAHCEVCAAYRDEAAALSQTLSFVEPRGVAIAPPPDLSDSIMAEVEPEWRRVARSRQTSMVLARLSAVILAVALIAWAVATLVSSFGLVNTDAAGKILDPAADPDLARALVEGGAARLGLGAGLFFVAWRPASAAGLVPVTATVFFFLSGFAMRDIALGQVDQRQVMGLLAMGAVTLVLAWLWISEKGWMLRAAWRRLGSDPN